MLVDSTDLTAWVDTDKITIDSNSIDETLIEHIEAEVLSVVSDRYNTKAWADRATTPVLIRRIISMIYVSSILNRIFSNDESTGEYANGLLTNAHILLDNIVKGITNLLDSTEANSNTQLRLPSIAIELVETEPMFTVTMEF